MSKEPGVVILDARSRQKYDELHIRDAVNLSFPDITVESLATMFPDKNAKILIYCNNNFVNAEKAFPSKMASASLNLAEKTSPAIEDGRHSPNCRLSIASSLGTGTRSP